MPDGGRQYWVRTEQGMIWGPYARDALERMRGRLNERVQISLDGKEYRPSAEFPELSDLLKDAAPPPPRPAQRPPPPPRSIRSSGPHPAVGLRGIEVSSE